MRKHCEHLNIQNLFQAVLRRYLKLLSFNHSLIIELLSLGVVGFDERVMHIVRKMYV